MMNILQVQCPHCDAVGQIAIPPMGSIIFGPCPKCQGPLAIFLGRTLPLDGEVMSGATFEERYEHLMEVLSSELGSRVGDMLRTIDAAAQAAQQAPQENGPADAETFGPKGGDAPGRTNDPLPITESDIEFFQTKELTLLDNADYFKSVFG